MTRLFSGGCHCGWLGVRLRTTLAPSELIPRRDSCGFCLRHAARVVSDPSGLLEIVAPREATPYRFAMGITDFHVCPRCGCYVAASWADGGALFGVVNVNALDARDAFSAAPVLTDFDSETRAEREARRRLGWTPARIVR
ncbi:hypothetical protein [Methylosinus sp. Sm6]|uniref:hypothetical protein n=1 Tax=Methylosinus sp. Sm6 TaxID=2866948 RepID=UPI001C99B062|nr:hypothetical protein [Methylosinus sp. Sm6]MBY6242122.1 hypothetical protein [Methylosinus sp. Sm6]